MSIDRRRVAFGLAAGLMVGRKLEAGHPTYAWGPLAPKEIRAADNSRIVIQGTGTFRVKPGNPQVEGGGTWVTFTPGGVETGAGTFEVTDLLRFELAPGGAPPAFRAGLAFLDIRYSDGDEGILIYSCHLGGTPDSVFEGINCSKGFNHYFDRVPPVGVPPFQLLDD